jgi:hypothetical protein
MEMKKILCALGFFGLVACGNQNENESNTASVKSEVIAPMSQPAPISKTTTVAKEIIGKDVNPDGIPLRKEDGLFTNEEIDSMVINPNDHPVERNIMYSREEIKSATIGVKKVLESIEEKFWIPICHVEKIDDYNINWIFRKPSTKINPTFFVISFKTDIIGRPVSVEITNETKDEEFSELQNQVFEYLQQDLRPNYNVGRGWLDCLGGKIPQEIQIARENSKLAQ